MKRDRVVEHADAEGPQNFITLKQQYLKVLNWNVSSVKTSTYEVIGQSKPDIVCLQEIRKELNSTPTY
jgi:hypothetical protein